MTTLRAIAILAAVALVALASAALIRVWLAYEPALMIVIAGALVTLAGVGIGAAIKASRRLDVVQVPENALILGQRTASWYTPHHPPALPVPDSVQGVAQEPIPQHPIHWSQLTRPGALLFGTDNGMPVYADLSYCAGIGIAGKARMGKTTLTRLLLTQAVEQGASLIVCDPHGARPESLLASLTALEGAMIRRAITGDEIAAAIALAAHIGGTRLKSRAHFPPLILAIDEMTALALTKAIPLEIFDALTAMIVQTAKVRIHAIVIGHDMSARTLGNYGAILRRALTHRAVFRCDPGMADLLLPSAQLARQAATLARGSALVVADDTNLVHVPEITQAEIAHAARWIPPLLPSPTIAQDAPGAAKSSTGVSLPPTTPLPPPTIADRIMDALRGKGGMTIKELADHLGEDEQVVRNDAFDLHRAGKIGRVQEGRGYRYRV